MQQVSKPLQILLHSIWLLLFVMAVVMYKERLYADASYYFFHAINSGGFHVEHGRVVLAISQMVPLIGYYLYMPLKVLMVLGSLGHEIFYYSIFLLLFYKLKDQAGGIAVLLIHVIGQLWLYYSPMLEICYGAALSVLFYSILKNEKYKDDKWLLLLLVVQWFVMTSHLENFILIATPIVYDIIDRGFKKRIHLILGFWMLLGFLLEFLTMSGYEMGKINAGSPDSPVGMKNMLDLDYLSSLWNLFSNYYLDLTILFILSAAYLLIQLKLKKALILIGSVLALIAIVNKAALANEFTRYYESMYNPLVTLVVVGFMYEVFSAQKKLLRNVLVVGLCMIALFRINWIWENGNDFRLRSTQMERNVDYLQSLGHSKYLANKENYQRKYSNVAWSNPIETLLYSAIDGKENCLSISNYDDYTHNRNFKILNDSNYIFRRFEIEDYSFLNPRFFKLNKEKYHTVNNGGFEKSYKELAKNIKIEIVDFNYSVPGDTSYLTVRIINENQEKIPSNLTEKIYLSYHWYKDNELFDWDGLRTPIEVDVYGQYEQDIEVHIPNEKGNYELVPDIVLEDRDWFMLGERYYLEIN